MLSGAGGGGLFVLFPKFSVGVPFFSMSPLNVPYLKEVTKNVHENQYSTRVLTRVL